MKSADFEVVDGVLTNKKSDNDSSSEICEYTAANGINAQIVTTSYKYKIGSSDVSYTKYDVAAYFVHDGIGYAVEASCCVYPEKTEYTDIEGVTSVFTFPESGSVEDTTALITAVLEAFEF